MEKVVNKSGGTVLSENLIVRWYYDAEEGKVKLLLEENGKEIASVNGYTEKHINNRKS